MSKALTFIHQGRLAEGVFKGRPAGQLSEWSVEVRTQGEAVRASRRGRAAQQSPRLLLMNVWMAMALFSGCGHEAETREREAKADTPAERGIITSSDRFIPSLTFFFSKGCPDCETVKETVIPLAEEMGIEIDVVDVDTSDGVQRVLEVEQEYGVNLSVLAPVVVYGDNVLTTVDEVQRFFQEMSEHRT